MIYNDSDVERCGRRLEDQVGVDRGRGVEEDEEVREGEEDDDEVPARNEASRTCQRVDLDGVENRICQNFG